MNVRVVDEVEDRADKRKRGYSKMLDIKSEQK